jgi:hypothetical protein
VQWIEYTPITEDSVVRRHEETFEEIKFRAALAVMQWESLQEKARAFSSRVQEAKNNLARVNEDKLTTLQSANVHASSSEASQALQVASPYRDTRP